MCVHLITQLLQFVGWLGSSKPHTSWVAVVTPTDRPKSVHNRCVIEVLVAFLCCQVAFWIFSVGVGVFVKRTETDLFLFLFTLFSKFYT